MSYNECLPLINQLSHRDKLKLARWLIEIIAQEDGVFETTTETEFVLQNADLMQQVELSRQTYQQKNGYQPNTKELNAILSV